MSDPTCDCGQPVKDVSICTDCQGRLVRALLDVPALTDELDTVLSRQTKQGGESVGYVISSPTRPLPYDVKASEKASALKAVLVSWVRLIVEERDAA